ncbi:Hepatocyte growth factor-regulated tyrosine kinase substrate, partial [Orchesella cincta]
NIWAWRSTRWLPFSSPLGTPSLISSLVRGPMEISSWEKATSNLLLEPEWASIIQICDLIRQKDCQPKYAMGQIKKKIHHTNPHVGFYALQVL